MKIKSIAIIGLGLMGGSLAAACRKKFPRARVIGISRDPSALRHALRRRWIHEVFQDAKQGVREADLIILCTPIDTFPDYAMMIDRFGRRGALVTDVGSLKGDMERFLSEFPTKRVHFVGAHPMVGSHVRGIQHAHGGIFGGGLLFLIRTRRVAPRIYREVKRFWTALEMDIVETTASEHDRIVGEISHLPHALAVALVLAVSPQVAEFSGPGFRDTTRIAEGHPSIWTPIFMANAKNLRRNLERVENQIKSFKNLLIKNDQKRLTLLLDKARRKRAQISL